MMNLSLPQLDPTWTVGLLTLDGEDVLSADGRAHALNALTPVGWTASPAASATNGPSASAAASTTTPAINAGLPSVLNPMNLLPAHIGARVAVGVVAIILVAIVAWRLTT